MTGERLHEGVREPELGRDLNVPVTCGGVTVHPGDVVLADDNGVVILGRETAAAVVDRALASDLAEPAILARLRAGEVLSSVLYLGA